MALIYGIESLFKDVINTLHPSIKFTFELNENVILPGDNLVKKLDFLDLSIFIHFGGKIETDIHYKVTNTHDYLSYHSHHPSHVKDNIPFTLAKKIIVFCSDRTQEARLVELKACLLSCDYPVNIINKGFHNARLQGPASDPEKKKKILPFITTYNSNLDSRRTVSICTDLLSNIRDDKLKYIFKNKSIVLAQRQPPNILHQISAAKFKSSSHKVLENGLFTFTSKKCKLCRLYIQECKSFTVANGSEWCIKGHITCNSKNVVYYVVCAFCMGKVSKTGKTNNFRLRMNNHISECKSGETSDLFALHVHLIVK